MKDYKLLNALWNEVDAGRVTASQCGSLTIFKYTQETHIKDLWNDVNRQARGIIFDVDGTVVARPFSKFFNLNERTETEPKNLPWSTGVEVYEKMDGSCGIGYIHNCTWRLATPGSMESDQAIAGTEILHGKTIDTDSSSLYQIKYKLQYLPRDCTPVFEIIYPENRIVVDYKGKRELVLLAIFNHSGEEWHPRRVDQIAELCGFPRPRRYDIDIRGDIPFEDNSEGYVARFGDGTRVKVKSPTYLRIHRILNHLSPKGVIELIRGSEYGTTVKQLPPAIAKDFDDIRSYVQHQFWTIQHEAQDRFNEMIAQLGENAPRKTYALWVQVNVCNAYTGLIYSLLDGKDIEDPIWKIILERIKEQ